MTEASIQQLVDAANELTEKRRRWVYLEYRDPVKHRRIRKRHDIGRMSLIDILERDVELDDDTSPKKPGGERPRGFQSRPPGHYAPRELLHAFTRQLAVHLADLGLDERNGPTAHVRAFIGIADTLADTRPAELAELAQILEHWADELRAYAGLDHIFRPRATCPQCAALGRLTVWINEDTRQADRARCGHCRAKWNATNVGILVEHIRVTNTPVSAEGAA